MSATNGSVGILAIQPVIATQSGVALMPASRRALRISRGLLEAIMSGIINFSTDLPPVQSFSSPFRNRNSVRGLFSTKFQVCCLPTQK